MNMREWRNRQTRTFEGRVGRLVRVQVPSLAPYYDVTLIAVRREKSPRFLGDFSLYMHQLQS